MARWVFVDSINWGLFCKAVMRIFACDVLVEVRSVPLRRCPLICVRIMFYFVILIQFSLFLSLSLRLGVGVPD